MVDYTDSVTITLLNHGARYIIHVAPQTTFISEFIITQRTLWKFVSSNISSWSVVICLDSMCISIVYFETHGEHKFLQELWQIFAESPEKSQASCKILKA